ncbi:MAG: oligosaccharide flippase family protein [Hyphomicrobiaceae bacterium]
MKSGTKWLLVRNAFHLGIGQVVTTALGILQTAIVGRALGPSDFGTLYIIATIISFVSLIIDWGQTAYLTREMAKGREDEAELIGSALLIRLTTTLFACGIAVATAFAMGYDQYVVLLALLAVVVTVPVTLYSPFGYTLRGKDRMDIDVYATIAGRLVLLATTFVALRLGGGLTEVILMQAAAGLASLLVGGHNAFRLGLRAKAPSAKAVRELVFQGAPIVLYALVVASQSLGEMLILSAFAGSTVVGWYGASRTVFGIAISPAMIALNASFPEFSRASLSTERMRHIIELTGRIIFITAAAVSSALYVFADHIIGIIFGYGHFVDAPSVLRAMAVFIPLSFLVLLLGSAMVAIGQNRELLIIGVVRIMACLIASWMFMDFWQQRFGNGAIFLVIVAGLSEIPASLASLVILPRGSVSLATILNLMRACATGIGAVLPLSILEPLDLWYEVPLFVIGFGAAALATQLVSRGDLRLVVNLARSRIASIRP